MTALWSVIDIDLGIFAKPVEAQVTSEGDSILAQKTTIFLSRSGESPLTIRIVAPTACVRRRIGISAIHPSVKSILKSIISHSIRWRELHVNLEEFWLGPSSPFHLLVALRPNDTPRLWRIVDNSVDSAFKGKLNLKMQPSPPLRRLELKSILGVNSMAISWESLTELNMGDQLLRTGYFPPGRFLRPDIMHRILKLCPNLIHCTMHLEEASPDRWGKSKGTVSVRFADPVELPRLQSLTLSGSWINHGMASQFILPSLTSLSILPSYGSLSDRSSLVEWGLTFGPQLTHFAFSYDAITRSNLLMLLRNMNKLVMLTQLRTIHSQTAVLELGDPMEPAATFDRAVWHKLTPKFDGNSLQLVEGCCCPSLQVLHCVLPAQFQHEIPYMEEKLVSFIVARQRNVGVSGHVKPLKELILAFPGPPIPSFGIEEHLQNRGVDTNRFLLKTISYRP